MCTDSRFFFYIKRRNIHMSFTYLCNRWCVIITRKNHLRDGQLPHFLRLPCSASLSRASKRKLKGAKRRFLLHFNSRRCRRWGDENDRVTAVTWKKRSVHLRRNVSLSLYTSFISLCTGRPPGGGRGAKGAHPRKVAKKNAKENANRPLDITGEMFPDLPSRAFYLACLPLTSTNMNFLGSLRPPPPS